MLHALYIHPECLPALWRLRVVEPDALNEAPVARPARIGHYHVVKRPFVGTAARQSNHNHWVSPSNCEKARIIREKVGFCEARGAARGQNMGARALLLLASSNREKSEWLGDWHRTR